jgi:hypothetical protein
LWNTRGHFNFLTLCDRIYCRGFSFVYNNMRIWDIIPKKLCRNHLLGEHRELHAIWSVLTKNKKGYSRHPETLRWKGRLAALYLRHKMLIEEMRRRGYNHNSKLNHRLASGLKEQSVFVDSRKKQKEILRNKHCNCKV